MKINTSHYGTVVAHTHSYKPADISPYASFEIPILCTLVAKPPESIKSKILEISQAIQKHHPGHYYYSPEQYHVTLLPLEMEVSPEVIITIQKILQDQSIKVIPKGVSINPYGVSIPVYVDENYSLQTLRNTLRKAFGTAQDYKEHNAIWDKLLWVNFMRFKTRPEANFFDTCMKHEADQLEPYSIKQWDLYRTSSKVLSPDQSELIHSFTV